jgi:23S rRNA G2445 N2-methylase RlmL
MRVTEHAFVLTCAPGLEAFAAEELKQHAPQAVIDYAEAGEVGFRDWSTPGRFSGLRIAESVFVEHLFDIPRPLALTGDQHWRRLMQAIRAIIGLHARGAFTTFAIAAAGRGSSVMLRLREALGRELGLADGDERGDLFLRLRPTEVGWQVLIRTTPRPLSARAWRVCDYPGALNAAAAAALITLLPSADTLVNLCSGSGSILIEALLTAGKGRGGEKRARFTHALGIDHAPDAHLCARANATAAGTAAHAVLMTADAARLPLRERSARALCADLPFGNLSGAHAANLSLYPAVLREARRIALPDARFVVLTHEVRLMTGLLAETRHGWALERDVPFTLRGLHPHFYVLRPV